ncbi:MAG: Ppx/GppA family phosphatase [Actinobacteria bacterium]|nr:MAG: Ppx/GppA family phosphatase [Actinomycetota bacterium]
MSPTSYQTAPPRVALHVLAKNPATIEVGTRLVSVAKEPAGRALAGQRGQPEDAHAAPVAHSSSISRVRVAVIDIGTNSTRLLIAEIDRARASVSELLRRSRVTRLGDGLESSGALADAAVGRVLETLREYRLAMDEHDVRSNLAVLTSAVRDAANGEQFAARVRSQFELDAHVLTGEEEAQLTFLGAMSDQANSGAARTVETVVVDVGGGSTEFIVGSSRTATYHASLPLGVVRISERHIHSDPPARTELDALAADARAILAQGLSPEAKTGVSRGIAVAGTATSAASIDQELDAYDPERVHGYELALATVDALLARLADMTESERRAVAGLNPDRAPTIVAGMVLLGESLRAFGLDRVRVSEHDILHGGALRLAGLG